MRTQRRCWASGRCRVKGKQPADAWDYKVLQHEGGMMNVGAPAEFSSLKGRTGSGGEGLGSRGGGGPQV